MIKNVYISNNTYKMLEDMKYKAIEKYSKIYHINPALIFALCEKESNNNPFAIRIEHHLKRARWYRRALTGIEYVKDYYYCSFGYMQILYGTARHIGYMGTPFGLLNVNKAIKYGTKFLYKCIRRYKKSGDMWDGVSAYNQGSNRKNKLGKYNNQRYVDSVKISYLHHIIQLKKGG